MQPANDSYLVNLTVALDFSRFGCIFADSQVSPLSVVVPDVFLQNSTQVRFIQNDQVVLTLPPYVPDSSFCESLPGEFLDLNPGLDLPMYLTSSSTLTCLADECATISSCFL
jgi:hypothetical protein